MDYHGEPTTGIFGDAGSAAEAVRFRVPAPNRLCVVDITAVWTLEGSLYLAAVLDLYDRQLTGRAIAAHMRTEPRWQNWTSTPGGRDGRPSGDCTTANAIASKRRARVGKRS